MHITALHSGAEPRRRTGGGRLRCTACRADGCEHVGQLFVAHQASTLPFDALPTVNARTAHISPSPHRFQFIIEFMHILLYNAIYIDGSTMGRWHVEYVKQLAEGKPKVHRHCKIFRKIVGMNHYAPDEIQNKTDCPIIRDDRENPAVEEVRPSKLADPNWPPKKACGP